MPPKVIDKHRVVDTTVRTRSPGWRVVGGVALVAAFLALWGASDIRAWVSSKESLPAQEALVVATSSAETVSEAVGLLAARRFVEGLTQPLQHTAKLGTAPPPPLPEASLVDAAPPPVVEEPNLGPGARWVGPEDPGGNAVRSVLVVGASSVQYYLGTELERRMEAEYPGVSVHRLGKLGTGLVRDDVFDWAAELKTLQATHKPQVVVAQFGGNDAQPITVDGKRIPVGGDGWDEAYRNKLVRVMRQIRSDGAVPLFVGMPVMRDAGFSNRIKRVNRVTQEAAAITGSRFVPTWDLAANPDGSYRVEIEHGGRRGTLRMQDGIHYSRLGAQYVAEKLTERLEQHVPLVPADPSLAVTVHRSIESAARGRTVPYMAFVPREVPPEGLPMLLLLHGAWDSWTAWSDHAHRDLQRLATEHSLVIVLPDGDPFGWYLDSDRVPGARIATHLVEELIPDAREHLPVNDRLGLGGLSMGGHGAIVTAMRNPGLATSVSSMSGAVDLTVARSRKPLQERLGLYEDAPDAWHAWSARHLLAAHPDRARSFALRLHTGDRDKNWTAPNRALHAQLDAAGIEHVWEEVPGGHTWTVWKAALPEHVAWHAEHLHDAVVEDTDPAP